MTSQRGGSSDDHHPRVDDGLLLVVGLPRPGDGRTPRMRAVSAGISRVAGLSRGMECRRPGGENGGGEGSRKILTIALTFAADASQLSRVKEAVRSLHSMNPHQTSLAAAPENARCAQILTSGACGFYLCMKQCILCRTTNERTNFVSKQKAYKALGTSASICSKCFKHQKKLVKRSEGADALFRLEHIKNSLDREAFCDAYATIATNRQIIEKEQSNLLRKLRDLEREKQAVVKIQEVYEDAAERNPELKYETARKDANAALKNPELRAKVFSSGGYMCNYCKSRDGLTIDHIHPVLYGGSNDLRNLQVLCRSCNSSKGAL